MSSETSPAEAFSNDLAAVGRAPHAADLEPGEDEIRVVRIEGDAASRAACITAGQVSGSGAFDALPGFRAVGRAEDAGRARAGEDQVGIVRRARDRPDAQARPSARAGGSICRRDVEPVDAGIGAGEQLARPLRDARRAPRRASRCTFPTCPRNAAAFRRGRRCTRRTVPPCRCRDEASRVPPLRCSCVRYRRAAGPRRNDEASGGRPSATIYARTAMARSSAAKAGSSSFGQSTRIPHRSLAGVSGVKSAQSASLSTSPK